MRELVRLHLLKVGLRPDDMVKDGTVYIVVWRGDVCARRERCGASEVALRVFAEIYKAKERAIAIYNKKGKFWEQR